MIVATDDKRRFWLSWPQPTRNYRPLADPLDPRILGWWCSGYDSQDRAVLLSLVKGTNLGEAKGAVRAMWPEAPSKRQAWRIQEEMR